jgi:hypothetical protein
MAFLYLHTSATLEEGSGFPSVLLASAVHLDRFR